MSMPSSTANWHWKTKHVAPWAKSWFERELVMLKASSEESDTVEIESVLDVEGDVEIGRRKSKCVDGRLGLRFRSGDQCVNRVDTLFQVNYHLRRSP